MRRAPIALERQRSRTAAVQMDELGEAIDYTHIIERNKEHLEILRRNPTMLMQVQGSSYMTPPAPVCIMLDALWETVFKAATANLDDDAPMVMLAAATRYLLAPPEKDDLVGQYPMVVRTRMRRLARGEGGKLWNEFSTPRKLTSVPFLPPMLQVAEILKW